MGLFLFGVLMFSIFALPMHGMHRRPRGRHHHGMHGRCHYPMRWF